MRGLNLSASWFRGLVRGGEKDEKVRGDEGAGGQTETDT